MGMSLMMRYFFLDPAIRDKPHDRHPDIKGESDPGIQKGQQNGYGINNHGGLSLPRASASVE